MEQSLPTVLVLLAVSACVLNSVNCTVLNQEESTPERECYGTRNGMSFSGSARHHYFSLRRRYTGCTTVRGNLELSVLSDKRLSYDMSFLSTIRVVTGYVLISTVFASSIPLVSLEQIRGDDLFALQGNEYSLLLLLTTPTDSSRGLRHLLLPSLTEISRGDVLFFHNPMLCYVNTIQWDAITRQDDQRVEFKAQGHNEDCRSCDDSCNRDGVKRCWGPGGSNCQQYA